MNKQNKQRGLLYRWDLLLIAALVVLACVLLLPRFFSSQDDLHVVVEHDGKVVYIANLAEIQEPVTFFVEGTSVEVALDQEGAAIVASNCPDQNCVRTGRLTRAGESAICLPNRVVVRLTRPSGSDMPDGITG